MRRGHPTRDPHTWIKERAAWSVSKPAWVSDPPRVPSVGSEWLPSQRNVVSATARTTKVAHRRGAALLFPVRVDHG